MSSTDVMVQPSMDGRIPLHDLIPSSVPYVWMYDHVSLHLNAAVENVQRDHPSTFSFTSADVWRWLSNVQHGYGTGISMDALMEFVDTATCKWRTPFVAVIVQHWADMHSRELSWGVHRDETGERMITFTVGAVLLK